MENFTFESLETEMMMMVMMVIMIVMMVMILVDDSNLRSSKLQPCSNPPCCASFVILC